ncbi:MAG: prepilin-type N-terminal cleavage/methylation domain-containing protein [Desulfobacterales bacterium]|jgi:prepilin-type N-terminal cleavage/methylation domain-containing protein
MNTKLIPNISKGFSLIELIVAIAMTSIVMAATVSAFVSGSKSHDVTEELVDGRKNARLALKILERDIRGAGSQVFRMVSPCGGPVYASTTMTELDPYRDASKPILLDRDAYPIQITIADGHIARIMTRGGGLGSSSSKSHVYEVDPTATTATTIKLKAGPQPDPDWKPNTLLLACGGDLDSTGGVIYKVEGGDFSGGYSVTCPEFTGSSPEAAEAQFIRSNVLAVMDVSYLAQQVTYQFDRPNKNIDIDTGGGFETILSGIKDVRLLVDGAGGYVGISAGDIPAATAPGVLNVLRIEVDAEGPENSTITLAGVVRLRNVP